MYLSDLHTHTIASGHGTVCTITDMAKAAAGKGLKLLGITDHGPATLAAASPSYYRSLTFAPRKRFGLEVMYGAECSILDTDGRLDLEEELLGILDYSIVSMHANCYSSAGKEKNTRAFLLAAEHTGVRILGHPDDPRFPLDYDLLIREAKQIGVVPEINEASLRPGSYRGDTRPCCRQILQSCMKYGCPVLLSSDSHGPAHVGDFTWAAAFVHEQIFPEELILNNRILRRTKPLSWPGMT